MKTPLMIFFAVAVLGIIFAWPEKEAEVVDSSASQSKRSVSKSKPQMPRRVNAMAANSGVQSRSAGESSGGLSQEVSGFEGMLAPQTPEQVAREIEYSDYRNVLLADREAFKAEMRDPNSRLRQLRQARSLERSNQSTK